jgi:hypothetical protein
MSNQSDLAKLQVLELAVITLFKTHPNPGVLAQEWGKVVSAEDRAHKSNPEPANSTEQSIADLQRERVVIAAGLSRVIPPGK